MEAISANAKGLSVLASLQKDSILSLIAVGAALLAGGWIVTVALAIH